MLNTGSEAKLPVLSVELVVPTINGAHVRVLERMIAEFDRIRETGRFFAGFWSIRFTRPTKALLGMQRYPDADGAGAAVHVCHIEVFSLRHLSDPTDMWGDNEVFVRAFVRAARAENARLHWGQLGLPFEDHEGLWYDDLAQFKAKRRRLAAATAPHAFENAFTARAGLVALEPGWTLPGVVAGPSSAAQADAREAVRSAPTLTADGDGAAWLVAANGDGRVGFSKYKDGASDFAPVPTRRGHARLTLAVGNVANGEALLAVTFDDGRIWWTHIKGQQPDPWVALEGTERFASNPAVVVDDRSLARLYAVSGGSLLESRQGTDAKWSSWRKLPAPVSGAVPIGRPAACLEAAGVRVVARTTLGEVYSWLESPGGAWTVANLGEQSKQDPVIARGPATVVALSGDAGVRVGLLQPDGTFVFSTVAVGQLLDGTSVGASGHAAGVSFAVVNRAHQVVLADFGAQAKVWAVRAPMPAGAVSTPALVRVGTRLLVATRVAHDMVQFATVPLAGIA